MAFSDRIGGSRPRGALRLAAVTVLGLSAAGCVSSDDSYFDDGLAAQQEDQPVIHRLLTGTVFDPPRAQIEYTARAPLVAPPSTTELPPPNAAGTGSAKAALAWPKDPEKVREEARAARARPDPGEAFRESNRPGERMTPEEVQAARIPGGGLHKQPFNDVSSTHPDRGADRLTPEQLAQTPAMPSSNRVEIGATPTRKYLIEPPSEYRTPASTAAMPEVKANEGGGGTSDGYWDPKQSKNDYLRQGS